MNTDTTTTVTGVTAGSAMVLEAFAHPDVTSPLFWLKVVGGVSIAVLGYLTNKQ